MLALAQGGVADGTWLRADVQSGGRGRLGRAWASPPGNLYASTIVRVLAGDPPAATLALVAAVALEEAVSAYLRANDDVKLKWPNDLIVGGKKLSGILLERADDAVVIGFGVNLAAHPALPDRPTTSLASHGIELSPEALLETLAEALARWLSRWRSEGLGPIRARWVARAHPTGSALSVRQPDGTTLEGLFDGLDQSGALMLRLADGSRHVMHAGDVFLLD